MFTNPEQFASATKTLFDLQTQTFNALANKAVQGVQQVVALNLQAAKDSAQGALAVGKELSQAKDPQQALAAVSSGVQPGMAGAAAYGAELKQVVDDILREFRDAADTHVHEAKNTLTALIHDVTQNVKPGSENAVEIIKAAIDNAFAGYEKVTQSTRDAVRAVEEQVAKATELVAPGMGKTTEKSAEE
ncbi:phasin family protein [Massilia agilis]|uniref:Phasin family protein n=1 Tax=Massilia agilis TaxID=1811226 RepID=A0ABT2D9R9_9BURK|nr:phasin family protein [Massilia agilis]MCS0808048.1 phasin family protein [Massilia agilis]